MSRKKYIILFLILMATLLVSVGASTWIITNPISIGTVYDNKITPVIKYIGNTSNGEAVADNQISYEYESDKYAAFVDGKKVDGTITLTTNYTSAAMGSDTAFTPFTINFEPTNSKVYESAVATANTTLKAVAYINTSYYSTVELALEKATNNNTVYVIPNLTNHDGTLYAIDVKKDLFVAENITLCLPYEAEKYISSEKFSDISSVQGDLNATNVKTYRSTLINLRNGADLIVRGTLQIGGIFKTVGNSGKYCEINLGKQSSIECYGTIYGYGFIKEDPNTAINSTSVSTENNCVIDNSCDEGRYLKVYNGGKLTTPLAIRNAASGGVLTSLADAYTCPINEFDMPSLQTYAIFEYGAYVDCSVRMTAASTDLDRTVGFLRASGNSDNALFYIEEGSSIAIEYIPKQVLYTSRTETGDYSKLILFGNVSLGYLYLDVTVAKIDTRNYFMPLSYKYNLYIANGCNFNVAYKIKILPGSKVIINNGGCISLNSSLAVYKSSDMEAITSAEGVTYPKTLSDAILINNGTIIVTENGSIGAFIQHEQVVDGNAKVILEYCDQSALSVISVEGTNAKEVIISSTAKFLNGENIDELQISANDNLTSVYQNDNFYWDGSFNSTYSIKVNISDNDFMYPIYSYTLRVSETPSGDGELLSAENATEVKSYDVATNQYLRIDINRAKSSTINIGGTTESIETGKWYQVIGDGEINIEPNEGVKVNISTSGNSGAGHVEYTLYESSDGTNFAAVPNGSNNTGKLTAYVVKGNKFKFTTKSSYGYYFTTKPVYASADGSTYTQIGVHGTENSKLSTSAALGNDIVYGTENYIGYDFRFSWNFEVCITEGTLIMLADGTQKPVEEITSDDAILVFNHETGKYEAGKIWYIDHANQTANWYTIVRLHFSDGTSISISYRHAFFDLELNKYVYIDAENYNDYIGHRFANVSYLNGEYVSDAVTLISACVQEEYLRVYGPISVYHFNIVNAGLLSMPSFSGDIDGFMNYFDYGEDMKFDEEKMQADIEKYGLFTYDDFKDYISEEDFENTPAKYFKVAIGKGILTWEEILWTIEYLYQNGGFTE